MKFELVGLLREDRGRHDSIRICQISRFSATFRFFLPFFGAFAFQKSIQPKTSKILSFGIVDQNQYEYG
jgi:hypothetical protein